MRQIFTIISMLITGTLLSGQGITEGTVTYITSQHIYVRFGSTAGLTDGDTLFARRNSIDIPALLIMNHSSTSCVCEPLGTVSLTVSDRVFAKLKPGKAEDAEEPGEETEEQELPALPDESAAGIQGEGADQPQRERQEIHGRLSVSSYTDLSSDNLPGRQRMRYTFSLGASHIGNTNLSLESYVSFSHSGSTWDSIRANIFHGIKIYNLSAKYQFGESAHLLAGRRINPRLSSVGAIDGLQFQKDFGSFTAGLIAGSRPDYADYGINPDLLQFGAYLGYDLRGANGRMGNTLAFVEQMNGGRTDRRFVYFQHTNSLVKNMFLFASAEADLYENVDGNTGTAFHLYNTYVSLRYRIIRALSVSLSYSARNNLVYYETYKDFLERLLEDETLQGWRFQGNYRPLRQLYLGAYAGYRYRKNDPVTTVNARGYVTYSGLPGMGGGLTATVTWMRSAYLDGMIYGAGYDREVISGKLNLGLKYHYVDYLYRSGESDLLQHVGEASLFWSVYRSLSLSVHYEGTFQTGQNYHRLYASLNQRF